MREKTTLFTVNGNPILVPDGDISVSYEDLDSADAGRDEAGFMHRIVVRSKVPSWAISYAWLTEAEKNYMENLFGDAPTFMFGHPSRLDSSVTEQTQCYRSKYGISWKDAKTGLWSGYSFHIIGC